ncbi:MAG: MerR family DNA-binding transcriptional regulator [Patescibacteria group bacterium]
MKGRYLTIRDAAKYVGVTPLTLRNWDKRGMLAAFRHPVNNYRLYRMDELEKFVKSIEGRRPKKLRVIMLDDDVTES